MVGNIKTERKGKERNQYRLDSLFSSHRSGRSRHFYHIQRDITVELLSPSIQSLSRARALSLSRSTSHICPLHLPSSPRCLSRRGQTFKFKTYPVERPSTSMFVHYRWRPQDTARSPTPHCPPPAAPVSCTGPSAHCRYWIPSDLPHMWSAGGTAGCVCLAHTQLALSHRT